MSEMSMQPERPTDWEILDILADHFDCDPEEVLLWLDNFDSEKALSEYRIALGTAQ